MTSTMTKNPLQALSDFGQAPWLDYVRRSLLESGGLKKMIAEDGLKGVTSNPSIFEKAIGGSTDYDEDLTKYETGRDVSAGDIYEYLAMGDIRAAADTLRPVYDAAGGHDGFISLEVSPYLAMFTETTIDEARRLWKAVDRRNLMVKVPGTEAGAPAIRTLIGEGININVTLLFAQSAYEAVAESYIAGLEDLLANGGDVSKVASVASFFVSRIDSAMDKKIDERIAAGDKDSAELAKLKGKVAIANAKLAYQHYLALLETPRWQKLAAKGAKPQRLLWASTGTKNKAYSDVLYVEELIGKDTVNTMPPATMDAFRDHGTPRASLTEDVEGARKILADTERLGLDLDAVTDELVVDGVRQFADAFDQLLGAVAGKRMKMLGAKLDSQAYALPSPMDGEVKAAIEKARAEGLSRRLWAKDATLWTGADESKWLAWLDMVATQQADVQQLLDLQADVKQQGFTHALLLGMGGSSLGPEVLTRTFGKHEGFPELLVLDSTDPQQIASFESRIDLAKTVFIVSSKSGSTLEPNILKSYFFDAVSRAIGADKAGTRFIAVTDPGSHMQEVAERDRFRHIFFGDPGIGGRYSVLSNFGMVPAAVIGLDLKRFIEATMVMVRSCGPDVPPAENPGIVLGAILGTGATTGRDKVTVVASPGISDVGAWLEQLLAESTGKQGHGIIPVDSEPLGAPGVYGNDRIFAYLLLAGGIDKAQDDAVAALEQAGQPVVRIEVTDTYNIGQEFFRWEIATAVAGSIIGINAFNQPDVEASKIVTRDMTDAYEKTGKLPEETPIISGDGLTLYADPRNADELAKAVTDKTIDGYIKAHLARAHAGDYAALLAYIKRDAAHTEVLTKLRTKIRDKLKIATCVGFGPRFLHSTGQAYKGGPNSGVFTQITADASADLKVPDHQYTFGVVILAQARGDFEVLAERGRRALRVHLGKDVDAGLKRLGQAIDKALS
ncbi:bifunctional transaldolase/phosoglucose isomerase [Rhodoligotrophos appendicifer]|uniref:bifunctional transaldolase/phosoglucose isomerase n=1 Tax=Rhodoligotrophos appendicifer TaxID=987056 RepID=UPI0011851683|nr:bifunctional transaldolase/phosoglucose isomerase [Rhodoligotrophos appendicifer]